MVLLGTQAAIEIPGWQQKQYTCHRASACLHSAPTVLCNLLSMPALPCLQVRGNLRQVDARLVELSNGCICCTLRDDLLTSVADILAEERFDYLVIESTGG
jgi:hypothetical protein